MLQNVVTKYVDWFGESAYVRCMAQRGGPVHVVTTRRHYKGRVYATHLLRRSYREDGKVKNETLGNLSHLPDGVIDIVRRALRGEAFVPAGERFEIVASRPHGDIDAVLRAMRRLDFASPARFAPVPRGRPGDGAWSRPASWRPHTKLATTRWWHSRTLAEDLGVAEADEDELYAAMDWLLERQEAIERKLAARHLRPGGLALYDLTSSYFEGSHCPLAALRLQPRRQEGQAAGQLGAAGRPARLSGGGLGRSRATPPTRRPCCRRSASCGDSSAWSTWCWSAIAA